MEYSDRSIMVPADQYAKLFNQPLQDSKHGHEKNVSVHHSRGKVGHAVQTLQYDERNAPPTEAKHKDLDTIGQVDDTGLLESDPLTLDNILLGLPARYKRKSEALLKLIHGKIFWDSKGQLLDENDTPIQHSHMTDLLGHLHLPSSKKKMS